MNQHTRIEAPLPFIDVAAQRRRLGRRIDDAIDRVLSHCQFINGPEISELERDLSAFCGARHSIGVSSGTDALVLILMALGIRSGDAVFCPAFTFSATAESVALVGATPVFVDVLEETFNLDPESLVRGIEAARRLDLVPKAVMAVDLFGLPADYATIGRIAQQHGLKVIDDAAQSFGATYHNRKIGMIGDVTATSFFPAKPLGCYGDGGAVFTDDDDIAALVKSFRNHGAGTDRYDNVRIGMNGRLDTIQAAVLIEKLKIFQDEIAARHRAAQRYNEMLGDIATVPQVPSGLGSVWAQYTIRLPAGQRDPFAAQLRAQGIPTQMYYPKPTHRQTAYRDYPLADGGLPVTDQLAEEVISLPMHAYLDEATQDRIVTAVRGALRA
jgi:UDP-2-acetamido-2-deoxy-ribo-hexuluronate aminotransferase